MLMFSGNGVLVIALTVALTFSCWFGSARAEELPTAETVESLMERLIPRNQLLSYGPGDYPTFYRWYVPIRLAVVSRDGEARAQIARDTVEPLLSEFNEATSFDAKLVEYQADANVLLVVGDNPQADFEFYADKIRETSNDPKAFSTLMKQVQPDSLPCHRTWLFIQGTVEAGILYTPSPSRDETLSRKCTAVNFAMLVGLIGTPSDGDTVTNIHNQDILFTEGDKAALRVLYDEEIDPSKKLNMATIESAISQILSR